MQRFKRILLYMGADQNEATLSRAFALALENQASLTLIDVVKPLPRALGFMTETADPDELERLVVKDHREKLYARIESYAGTNVPIEVCVAVGDPAVEITRQVMRGSHDLVVKTAGGTQKRVAFGGVARSLMRICPCPVWILKPEIYGEFDQVLAAIDVEAGDQSHQDLNLEILQIAHAIAQREKAQLHIVVAWSLWMESALRWRAGDQQVDTQLQWQESRVRQAIASLLESAGVSDDGIETHVFQGTAATIIQQTVDKVRADLLVMGTVCRTRIAGFLIGNTAESILDGVNCSLLALKPTGFVSPVEV